ncbi:hypothetical protein V6Z11_A04G031400 [Gossypium hirsutum]
MLEGKAVIGDTDMLQTMQQDALHLAAKALDFFDVTEATDIARFVKKSPMLFVMALIMKAFSGCFIYFCIGSLAFLLFKGSAVPQSHPNQFNALETVKA